MGSREFNLVIVDTSAIGCNGKSQRCTKLIRVASDWGMVDHLHSSAIIGAWRKRSGCCSEDK